VLQVEKDALLEIKQQEICKRIAFRDDDDKKV
jgi:hypothetical protein